MHPRVASRRGRVLGACCAVLLSQALRLSGRDEVHFDVGSEKQLFIDERFVASSRGVRLTVNAPQKTGERIVVRDRPWEGYIGEWHSHPSFDVKPSPQDVETMVKLVTDPAFRGSFATLMIVRLDGDDVSMGAWLFDPQGTARAIDLEAGSGRD